MVRVILCGGRDVGEGDKRIVWEKGSSWLGDSARGNVEMSGKSRLSILNSAYRWLTGSMSMRFCSFFISSIVPSLLAKPFGLIFDVCEDGLSLPNKKHRAHAMYGIIKVN